ncbi:hypothetical protein [Salinisphaera sp. G21_0]|uniref:hypothetical protein n=1 Tax=Salinisphaera sp. G21_0 TaxID=2821094 RepID=UPI001ADB15A8|nr:hypothetical protein [Salinisphaera sp. G21_0]MBO9482954.1 hypothetical protein [Salinisphaera sp. G21_0]
MSNVNGPRGTSFSTPPEFLRDDHQETAKEKEKGDISSKPHRYVQSVRGRRLHEVPGKPFSARSIRTVPVLDIKIRGLLKSDHFRDVEKALNSGGDIKADGRNLQSDLDEVENILIDIQTKSAKKEVDLDADFSAKLKNHLNDLKRIDLSSPKELAQIIVSSMDDIRDWHFNAGYDKTLITGKQLIDSEGKLRDILSNYSVGNPGVTKQEVIAPVRDKVSGDESHPVTPASADDQTTSAGRRGTALIRPDGEKTPAVISEDTLISTNGHDMPAVTSEATDEDGKSGYKSDVTSSVSPVDKKTEKSPSPVSRGVSNAGTQALPVPDGSPGSMSEGTGNSLVWGEAKESGGGSDAISPKAPVDKRTETSPTSSARRGSTTGTQTLPVSDSPGPMPEETGKSPDVNETGKSGDGSDVDSLSSPDDPGAETSLTSLARRASSAGTQTDPDSSMPEETGNSTDVDETKESGDGSNAISPSSLVDQGTETSPTLEALGGASTGSQTSSVTDSPKPMPEETGKSPVGDEAGKSGDGSDVASLLSPVDQGTKTSPTSEATGAFITGSQTTSVPESLKPMPKGTGTSPVGDEAKESGESSDVASLSSSVDQGTETSSTSIARHASTTGTQTLAVPDGSPGSIPKETGISPVGYEAEESDEGSDITSPASLVDQGTETSPETLGASSTGSQTSSVPDSPGPMPEETGKSPVGDEAGKSGDGSDVASLLSPVDQGTKTSPTSEATGAFITGSQTTSVPESLKPMPKGTGTSPVGDEAKESGESSDVASLSSSVDQGTETSSTSIARHASTTGTQTLAVPDGSPGSIPKETGISPVGYEAEESDDGSDIASPASLVDQGTETSRETLGASSTGSQTSLVPDSPGPMPEEIGTSPVGDEAGKSGDGSDVASLLSPFDQGTKTSSTSEAPGAFITGSKTSSVPESLKPMPKGTGTSPVGDEAKKSGESSDIASLSSSVDQGTETSSTSLARRASTSGTQTLPVPDGSPGSMPEETGISPVGYEAEESGEGSDIASPASLVDQGTETSPEALGAFITGSQTSSVPETIRPTPEGAEDNKGTVRNEAEKSGVTPPPSAVDIEIETSPELAASEMAATGSQTSPVTDDSINKMPEEIGVRQSPVGGEAEESVGGSRPVTPPSSPVDTETGTGPIPVAKGEDDKNSPPRQFADASTNAKPETANQATSPIPETIDDKSSLMAVASEANGDNTPAPVSSEVTDSSDLAPQVTVDSTSNSSKVTEESNSQTPAELPEVTSPTAPDQEPGELEQYLNNVPVNQEAVQLSGVHQNTVALQQAVNSMAAKVEQFNNWKDAEIAKKEITWLEGEDRKLEPSNTRLRNAIAGQIQTLGKDINQTVKDFKNKYGNRPKECKALEDRASSIKVSLQQQKDSIDESNRAITGPAVQKWLADLDKTSTNYPNTNDYMEKVLPDLASVFASNNGEACSYLAGQTIDRVSRELVRRCNAEVAKVPGGEGRHLELQKLYMQYAQRLQQLDPQRIPARVHQGKLSIRGEQFAQEAIRQQEAELGKVFGDQQTDAEVLSDTSSSASEKQAARLIEDARIRPRLLALLNSLKAKQEGITNTAVEKAEDLDAALTKGLLDIRDQFNLHPMPGKFAVLEACQSDLKKPNSKLAAESVNQHKGQLTAKNGQPRYKKLKERCDGLREKLDNARDFPETTGQKLEFMEAFHQKSIFDYEALKDGAATTEGSFTVTRLGRGKGPLSEFFAGVPNANYRKADEGAESIAIDGGKPEGIVFEKNRAGDWHGMLGNRHYTLHPRFLYEYPKSNIPFADNWLPVRADDGKPGILVLQTTAQEPRYFLYEPDGKGELKPRSIDATSDDELVDAEFLLRAAKGPGQASFNKKPDEVAKAKASALRGGVQSVRDKWNKTQNAQKKLASLYHQTRIDVEKRSSDGALQELIGTRDQSELLAGRKVRKSQYTDLQNKKENKKKVGTHLENASLKSADQRYQNLSPDTSFDQVGKGYYEQCRKKFGSNELIELGEKNLKVFKAGAFHNMSVFAGCEIKPDAPEWSDGSIHEVASNFDKVVKVNRDRQLRLSEGVDYLTRKLGTAIRNENKDKGKELDFYRDDELVDFAINQFKNGHLPESVGVNRGTFCDDLVQLMLVKNERDFCRSMGRRMDALKDKLAVVRSERFGSQQMPDDEFKGACQALNLDMALLAGAQKEATERIESHYRRGLDEQSRAMISFEQGGLVLRGDQPKMAEKAFKFVQKMGKGRTSKGNTLVFQLGTGYGKSKTIIPLVADQACRKKHPVRIIAPANNQAELDHSLTGYFADSGVTYRRLDLFKDFVSNSETPEKWWSPEVLKDIKAQVTAEAPLGISTKDVLLLMTLRDRLKTIDAADYQAHCKETPATLKKEIRLLDDILDSLQYDGLKVVDEYDRLSTPSSNDEFKEQAADMSRAQSVLGTEPVNEREVAELLAAFLSGSKNKVCLSATMGTGFTMAGLTKSATVKEAAKKCESNAMTTQARLFNWLSKTTPILSGDTSDPENRINVLKQVMERSGKDKQIILFDGNHNGEDRFMHVKKDYEYLKEARGGKVRGLLYYNEQKQLCLYHPKQEKYQQSDAVVSPELEALIRKNPEDYDVRLDKTQGTGTDCPQSATSVGIHLGMLEDNNRRGNIMGQEFGRFSRASSPLNIKGGQEFFMVLNTKFLPPNGSVSHEYREKQKELTNACDQADERAQEAMAKLLAGLDNKVSPEQLRVIHAKLHVSPPDEEGQYDTNLERDLGTFIKSWECNVFPHSVKTALADFKRAQWYGENQSRETIATMMALREDSSFVKACETSFERGSKRADVDEILSSAHTWRGYGAGQVLDKVELGQVITPVESAGEYNHQVYVKEFESQLRSEVHKELQKIERESFDSFNKDESLEAVAKSKHMDDEIKKCITKLQKSGIRPDSQPVIRNIPQELKEHCGQLWAKADRLYSDISSLCNNGKPIENKRNKDIGLVATSGWDRVKAAKQELDDKLRAVKDRGDLATLTEFCREQDSAVEVFYHELAKALSAVTFAPDKNNNNNFGKLCGFLGERMPGLKEKFRSVGDRKTHLYPAKKGPHPTEIMLTQKSGLPTGKWNWQVSVPKLDDRLKNQFVALEDIRKEDNAKQMARAELSIRGGVQLTNCLGRIQDELLAANKKYRKTLVKDAARTQDAIDRRKTIKLQ